MHQKVHSAVLDKEKEHRIYNSIYIWFLKTNLRRQPKRENIFRTFLVFRFFPSLKQLLCEAARVWNLKKKKLMKCFCTDSCNTRYSLLPMPLKSSPIFPFLSLTFVCLSLQPAPKAGRCEALSRARFLPVYPGHALLKASHPPTHHKNKTFSNIRLLKKLYKF